MNANETISVIVPVYNAEKWLRRCVESLEAQTYPALQPVLVNDGSTDGSLALCRALAAQYGNILVCSRENGGAAAARNTGLAAAEGAYIGFVDADDFVEPDMYEAMYRALRENGAQIACCGRVKEIDGVAGAPQLTLPAPCAFGKTEALARFFAFDGLEESICDKLFDANLAKSHRFVEGSVCEDILYAWETLQAAERVCHIGSKPMYHYCFETAKATSASAGGFTEARRALLDYPRRVYHEAAARYPALQKQAQSYYLRRLLDIYAGIRAAGQDTRAPGPAREASHEFQKNAAAMLANPYFPTEKKPVAAVYALHAEKAVAAASKAVRGVLSHGKA
ncbi:MAG: glycosyltransferase [Faecalibacterium sp.]|jgi:glycosyltransferase involved in cell wall biosynthesis|nr:glycosyltransferase [Faecalibacterium sp.]